MPSKPDILISSHDTHVGDAVRNLLSQLCHYPQMWVYVLGVFDAA